MILTEGKAIYSLLFQDQFGEVDELVATNDHQFWVKGLGWVNSGGLEAGMEVETYEGHFTEVNSVTPLGRVEDTFNITVADYHTYYAGDFGVLVHNCGCEGDEVAKGTFPTKFHKRSVEEVAQLRKEFESVKPEFVRSYASSTEAAKRFTSQQLAKMTKSGKLPKGFIIHHKNPLFRGGDNSFNNFRVMNSKFHQRYNKRLHWYDEGKNIY